MSEELASLLLDPMNSSRKLSPSPSPLGTRLQVVGIFGDVRLPSTLWSACVPGLG